MNDTTKTYDASDVDAVIEAAMRLVSERSGDWSAARTTADALAELGALNSREFWAAVRDAIDVHQQDVGEHHAD